MRKRLVALLGVAVLVLAACQPAASNPPGSGSAASGGPGQSGATGALDKDQIMNVYCCSEDPRNLEPVAASGSDEISIIGAMHRSLLYLDKDGKLVPSLAKDLPEVADEGKTLTYHLREDAKYSNGDPIVAGDVVRAVRHLADPRNAWDYGYEMCYLVGADKAMGSDFCSNTTEKTPDIKDTALVDSLLDKLGAEATDDHTVVFHLQSTVSYFPYITAMWLLSPVQESATKYDDPTGFNASGPFMMQSYAKTSEIVLIPNPNWYGTKPTLKEYHIHIGGSVQAALQSYERGDLDLGRVPGTDIARIGTDPARASEIRDTPQNIVYYFDFQTCELPTHGCPTNAATKDHRSPSSYKNFRIALTEAIDKQKFIDQTSAGLGIIANGSVMPEIPGDWPDPYNPYPFDEAKAKADMGKALDDMGIPTDPALLTEKPAEPTADCDAACALYTARVHQIGRLKFGYNCNSGHDQPVFFMYDAWRTILGFAGSQFDISCTDFGTFRTERRAGNVYDLQRNAWGQDFPHPDNQLRDLFATGAGNNNNGYSNPAFDELLNKGAAELDPAKSEAFYHEAQKLVVDDAAVLFLRFYVTRYLVPSHVTGIVGTASDHENIGDVFPETYQILEH